MFTGIVEDVGRVFKITKKSDGIRLVLATDNVLNDVKIGDSIAVNGVCLTVVELDSAKFSVDVSFETINKSNIGMLKVNDYVNLEKALKLSDRLDGHIVLGHVDSKASIGEVKKIGDFYVLKVYIDDYVFGHCVDKGSVAVDGISLTISRLESSFFEVAVIPHTFENTNLKYKKPGDLVNIEVDILGKYVEKMLKKSTIDERFLAEHGFA